MKNLKRLASFAALLCFCSCPATAQEPSAHDVENPDFKIEKEKVPYRSNFRHARIEGLHPDGRLLVRCSPSSDEKDEVGHRFWVSLSGDSVKMTETELPPHLWEIARYDRNIMYYTTSDKGDVGFYWVRVEKNGMLSGEPQPVNIETCGEKTTISNPFIFHPLTSNYPVLLFSDEAKDRKDKDIFYSELIDGIWSCPRSLAAEGVNTERYDETHPFVDKDGILFFSSNRPHPDAPADSKHNRKKSDLYCTTRSSQPFWSDAAANPLPAPFNTPGDERAIAPLAPGLRSGLLISDAGDGPLQLFAFKSTAPDTLPQLRHHALVVGVNDYEYIPDLDSPLTYSRQLAQILTEKYGFNTSILENPTSAQFLDKLAQYNRLDENEYLLVVFFGHGFMYDPPDDDYPLRSTLEGRDCKCTDWAESNDPICEAAENCITPEDFVNKLKLVGKPRHILVLLDVCFGGLFNKLGKTRGEFDKKSRKMIASTRKEEVPDKSNFFVGLKNKLILGPQQKEGEMTARELFEAIHTHMANVKAANEPIYESFPGFEDGGEFTFPKKKN